MDFSIIIAGRAGEGARASGHIIAEIFLKQGYYVYIYEDYQSLIRGGHNFANIRISDKEVLSHTKETDLLIALNKESVEKHKENLKEGGLIIIDENIEIEESENILKIFADKVIEKIGAPKIMKNTALISAFIKTVGIDFELLEKELENRFKKGIEKNLKIAKEVYEKIDKLKTIPKLKTESIKKLIDGNESVALGAVNAGLETYIAYPMTPATSILHFLAKNKEELGVKVVQPESEISVLNMALGASYAGRRVAVATSGGGFALMTETLSLSAMAEIPVLIVESQRMSPASGVPTYNGQSDLLFALNAGHGDFYKFTVAPGDAKESFEFSKKLLNLSFKYQTPSLLLIDKQISESAFTIDKKILNEKEIEKGKIFDKNERYERYKLSEDGISPITFPGEIKTPIKVNSYEHDEYGITTEDPVMIKKMQDKRLLKYKKMKNEVDSMQDAVKTYGNQESKKVFITWGSSKGPTKEAVENTGFKMIQILMLEPFPKKRMVEEIGECNEIIVVEQNSTGQLSQLLRQNGITPNREILKYNSRPLLTEEILKKM